MMSAKEDRSTKAGFRWVLLSSALAIVGVAVLVSTLVVGGGSGADQVSTIAASGDEDSVSVLNRTFEDSDRLPAVFEGNAESLSLAAESTRRALHADGTSIYVARADSGDGCVFMLQPTSFTSFCATSESFADRGMVFSIPTESDGDRYVVGMTVDQVSAVSIGDRTVAPRNNVFLLDIPAGETEMTILRDGQAETVNLPGLPEEERPADDQTESIPPGDFAQAH